MMLGLPLDGGGGAEALDVPGKICPDACGGGEETISGGGFTGQALPLLWRCVPSPCTVPGPLSKEQMNQ